MLCENCGKNQANFYYKTSINGETQESRLCGECVAKLGGKNISGSFENIGADSILSKFLGGGLPGFASVHCHFCGASPENLSETGRVGCAECYRTFSGMLTPYIRRVQGGLSHTGRVPKSRGKQINLMREIKRLKTEQREAIDLQDFERAAELRDEIRRCEEEAKL